MAELGRDRDRDAGALVPPRSEAEICAAVKDAAAAGLTVRALGSGHSFTAVAATAGVALDLSRWTGVTAADTRTGLVTARSGTTLRALNAELGGLGLAMANLGDIDAQTHRGRAVHRDARHRRPAGRAGHPGRGARAGAGRRLGGDLLGHGPGRTCSRRRGSASARSA